MKLGIWDPTRIILRSGPNSETPPGGSHLEFQNGRHSEHINLPTSKTMIDRNVLFVASPPPPPPIFRGKESHKTNMMSG